MEFISAKQGIQKQGNEDAKGVNMEYLAKLEAPVLGFSVQENHIDCLCGKKLQKIDKESGNLLYEREIFEKEGLARIMLADNGQIFISDFCTLYAFCQDSFELLGKWQLGEDLRSDICGMAVDKNTVYCSIRNGKLITMKRDSFQRQEYVVSDNSMWSLKIYSRYLLCGTVDGQLLLLDKETMAVQKRLRLGKQNIRSLYIDEKTLYAASQDKKLYKISLPELEVIDMKRNVHKKMFDCAGLCRDVIVTVSFPCSEIALWNKDTLEKVGEIPVPLKLSGCTYIDGEKIYISSRNINGIVSIINQDWLIIINPIEKNNVVTGSYQNSPFSV